MRLCGAGLCTRSGRLEAHFNIVEVKVFGIGDESDPDFRFLPGWSPVNSRIHGNRKRSDDGEPEAIGWVHRAHRANYLSFLSISFFTTNGFSETMFAITLQF